jgi:hypothetical protein
MLPAMAGSMKDELEKTGLIPPEPVKPPLEKKEWLDELPDDETLPPRFDAPALLKPSGSAPSTIKK